MYIQVSTLWGLPVYPSTTMQGTNGSSDLALHPTDPPHDSAASRSQESHKSLGQRCAPVMECKFEGGKFDDFIVQDPYVFPAAHSGKLVGLWCNGGLCGLLAFVMFLPWFRPKTKDCLKVKLCLWYAFLTSCGNSLEALATSILSENETGRASCPWLLGSGITHNSPIF